DARVLFYQQHGDAVCLIDRADDLEDRSHHKRGQAERGFIEQHQPGFHEQCTREGKHLLLAPGKRACRKPPPLLEHREVFEDAVVVLSDLGSVASQMGSKLEVFVDRQLGADTAALWNVGYAATHDLLSRHAPQRTAVKPNLADSTKVDGDRATRSLLHVTS